MPLQRRLPKRGFTNINRVEYQVVNLFQLEQLEEAEITPEVLQRPRADRPPASPGEGAGDRRADRGR